MTEEKQVVKFSVAEADIAKKSDIYMELTVTDPNDEEGFAAVDTARKVMKGDRVAVQKREKELKEDANAWRKKVGNRAKELYALIEPIEEHLKTQCKIVTDEQKRREEAEEKAFQEKLDNRVNELAAYNSPMPYQELATMPDEDFETHLSVVKKTWEQEREYERLAEEERQAESDRIAKEQKIEADRLEKERLEFEEKQRVANIERDRLAAEYLAEQDRIATEQQAAHDKANAEIEAKQAKIDAKEAKLKAAEDAEKEKARVQQEEVDRVSREAEDAERAELLKPDKVKLGDWLNLFFEIPDPELANEAAEEIRRITSEYIFSIIQGALNEVKEL